MAREDVLARHLPRDRRDDRRAACRCTRSCCTGAATSAARLTADPRRRAQDFPICVPIATHAPHAVGVAYAFKLRREPRVAVCVARRRRNVQGRFLRSVERGRRVAAAGRVRDRQQRVGDLRAAARPVARGKRSRRKPLPPESKASRSTATTSSPFTTSWLERALAKARRGGGPHVIEALTYRMTDHTTADDARRYRPDEELERWRQLDPIARLRKYLTRERLIGAKRTRKLSPPNATRRGRGSRRNVPGAARSRARIDVRSPVRAAAGSARRAARLAATRSRTWLRLPSSKPSIRRSRTSSRPIRASSLLGQDIGVERRRISRDGRACSSASAPSASSIRRSQRP